MNKETQSTAQESDYIPYGPEWEKELMQFPKKGLIGLLRKSYMDSRGGGNPVGSVSDEGGQKGNVTQEPPLPESTAHQFKQSPSDAQKDEYLSKSDMYAAYSEYEKEDGISIPPILKNHLTGFLDSFYNKRIGPSHKEEPQGMKAALKDLVDKVELLLDTSPHNDGYEPILDDVYDCLKSCNKLLSSDAGQSSNVKEDVLNALLSGKTLYNYMRECDEYTLSELWCEETEQGKYFYMRGWGTAFGSAEDRVIDVIKNPHKWSTKKRSEGGNS
jgi:hypothetical protein